MDEKPLKNHNFDQTLNFGASCTPSTHPLGQSAPNVSFILTISVVYSSFQILLQSSHTVTSAGQNTAIIPYYLTEILKLGGFFTHALFADPGQVWHVRVYPQSTLMCQTASELVHYITLERQKNPEFYHTFNFQHSTP